MAGQDKEAEKLIREHMIVAMGAGLLPVPFADWGLTTAVQLNLVRKLASLYEVPFFSGMAKGLIAALVGGTTVRGAATLVKVIPGIGWMIGGLTASVAAAATTYAVGRVFQSHFAAGGTLRDFDVEAAKKAYQRAFREGQTLSEALHKSPPPAAQDPYEQLKKLHELYQAGILTAEEYEAQKKKLLERL